MKHISSFLSTTLAAVIITLAFQPTPGFTQEGTADQAKRLVASVLDAYGGKEAVSKVKSVVAKGTIADFMRQLQGDYSRSYARLQKLRIEIMADQAGELRILNGSQGWRGSRKNLTAVQGPPLEAMRYQYTYLDLPMGFADGTYTAVFQGKTEYKGRELNLLVVEAKGGPKVKIYLDLERNLIVRVASEFTTPMGSSELSTEFEDFRPVGKVLFPFRLVNYAGDMNLSVISLSDIKLNPELPDSEFTPPSGK